MNIKVLIGSSNEGKISEIKQILEQFEILCKPEIFNALEIIEDGDTFEQNALLKANIFYKALKTMDENLVVMTDDSGLCVDILDGEPGIYSARYANLNSGVLENASDKANIECLIEKLHKKSVHFSEAKFVCVIAIIGKIKGKWIQETFRGELLGRVVDMPSGKNGFGYDPLFIPVGHNNSLAQMQNFQKNKISHRKKALEKTRDFLIKSIQSNK